MIITTRRYVGLMARKMENQRRIQVIPLRRIDGLGVFEEINCPEESGFRDIMG
jgi:hypothetical protein